MSLKEELELLQRIPFFANVESAKERRVTIEEADDPVTGRPQRIVVTGQGRTLDLRIEIAVESAIVSHPSVR